nr:unnamed protein product [Nymphaea colorata]
MIIKAN